MLATGNVGLLHYLHTVSQRKNVNTQKPQHWHSQLIVTNGDYRAGTVTPASSSVSTPTSSCSTKTADNTCRQGSHA